MECKTAEMSYSEGKTLGFTFLCKREKGYRVKAMIEACGLLSFSSFAFTQNWAWNSGVLNVNGKHTHTRMCGGAVQGVPPPIYPLTCTLEPIHGVRGPCPQEASEISLGRITRLDLPLGLALWWASEVKIRLPGSVLLPLWGHQSRNSMAAEPWVSC